MEGNFIQIKPSPLFDQFTYFRFITASYTINVKKVAKHLFFTQKVYAIILFLACLTTSSPASRIVLRGIEIQIFKFS